MQKHRARKKLRKHSKLMLQKSMVILFILALIFSSFGNIGAQVYANEEDSVESSEQIGEDPKTMEDDEETDDEDDGTDASDDDQGTNEEDGGIDASDDDQGTHDEDDGTNDETEATDVEDDSVDSVDKIALETKFEEVDSAGLDEASYTEASWKILQDALTEADSVLSDDDATQDEVDETLAALTAAYNGLKDANEPTDPKEESTSPEKDYDWSDNGDGTVTITGYTGSDTDLTIPDQLDGKDVTGIGMNAFAESQLTSVDIPEGVTEIGDSAFVGNKLTSIDIPDSVTKIGAWAFGANQLTSVDIPEGVKEIGNYAFARNKLTSVVIPESVTKIGWQAFEGNDLTDVTILNPDVEFEGDAFTDNQQNAADLTIHGYHSSTAEAFADKHGYTFKVLDETTNPEGKKKSKDLVVVGEQVDSNKGEKSVKVLDEADTKSKLPMTATSFYTLIFGGLLLIILGIATFIVLKVRKKKIK